MSILSQLAVTQAQALASSTLGRIDYFTDSLDNKLKAYDELNNLQVVQGSSSASGISYTLTVPANWNGNPLTVQAALDELASRIKGIEGKTDFITVTAAIDLDDVKSKAESAIQSGDNVSELVNDAGYVTSSSLFNISLNLDDSLAEVTRVFAGGRTTFTITHNFNSKDFFGAVIRLSDDRIVGGWREENVTLNTVQLSRNGNIANGLFRFIV